LETAKKPVVKPPKPEATRQTPTAEIADTTQPATTEQESTAIAPTEGVATQASEVIPDSAVASAETSPQPEEHMPPSEELKS
jgi:hypothetical protein